MPHKYFCALAILIALLAIGSLSIFPPENAVAQGDTEPPHLVSFEMEPLYVDTTSGDQYITVTAHITDDLSGTNYFVAIFNRFDTHHPSPSTTTDTLLSGTVTDGIFTGMVRVQQYMAEGRYYLKTFSIYDKIGNGCHWYPFDEPQGNNCELDIPIPYFINIVDSGPPATATPTPTPTMTPDWVATAVVATLTAIAVEATPVPPEPCTIHLPLVDK